MSATISRPTTGHKSATPFGVVAVLAGAIALGAAGFAFAQSIKPVPATAVPAYVQSAMIAHRAAERASLETVRDPRLVVAAGELKDRQLDAVRFADTRLMVNASELKDRIAAEPAPVNPGMIIAGNQLLQNEALFAARYNSATSIPATQPLSLVASEALIADRYASLADNEALFAARYNSATSVAGPSLAEAEALFAARYNSAPSITTQPLSLIETESLIANRYGANTITGTGTGPQTAAQKGLVGKDRWSVLAASKYAQEQMSRTIVQEQPLRAHPARHPVAN